MTSPPPPRPAKSIVVQPLGHRLDDYGVVVQVRDRDIADLEIDEHADFKAARGRALGDLIAVRFSDNWLLLSPAPKAAAESLRHDIPFLIVSENDSGEERGGLVVVRHDGQLARVLGIGA